MLTKADITIDLNGSKAELTSDKFLASELNIQHNNKFKNINNIIRYAQDNDIIQDQNISLICEFIISLMNYFTRDKSLLVHSRLRYSERLTSYTIDDFVNYLGDIQ